jgi:hypothetical protein
MPALELISAQVIAPGTTLTALSPFSGNSFTIRNAPEESNIYLIQTWVKSQGSGIFRIRSPFLHDNVQGLRFRHKSGQIEPLLADGYLQKLKPQDTLILEMTGSSTSGDIEQASLLVYYENLPGIEGHFIGPDELASRMEELFTVEVGITAGTSGGYSGEKLISQDFDLFKANTDYAILGYITSADCLAVRLRSSDFGNLGIGGPGESGLNLMTRNWFVDLSYNTGFPLIPVFNSANRTNTFVDVATDENGGTFNITFLMAKLKM